MSNIAVFNQKGGVGKTTTALNLAAAFQLENKPTLLIDMDPQNHLSQIFSQSLPNHYPHLFQFYSQNRPIDQLICHTPHNGGLIASNAELIKVDSIYGKGPTILKKLSIALEEYQKGNAGLVVMDCCPYIGVLSLGAIFAADIVLVPIACDFFSLNAAKKVENTLKALEPVLKKRIARKYLLTRYDRRRKMTSEIEMEARSMFSSDLLTTAISENITVAESPHRQINVFQLDKNSTGAKDYYRLAKELETFIQ